MGRTGAHHADLHAFFQHAVAHAHQHDHAKIGIIPGIHQQRGQRRRPVTGRRRQFVDKRFEHVFDADTGLGRYRDRFGCIEPDHVLDLLADLFGFRRGQIDLVEHGNDLVISLDREIGIGQCLRFDTLG